MKALKPRYAALAACLLILSACTSLGFERAQSLDERIHEGVTDLTAINDAVANSLASHGLSSEDAQAVLDKTREGKGALNLARAALDAGDLGTAEGRLNLGIAALTQAREHLAKKGVTVRKQP
jgi:hypothetical protein